jgi:hypothetical protein
MENLHGLRGQVDVYLLMHQRVRHAVEMLADLDLVVDVDAGAFPFSELEARRRQRPSKAGSTAQTA